MCRVPLQNQSGEGHDADNVACAPCWRELSGHACDMERCLQLLDRPYGPWRLLRRSLRGRKISKVLHGLCQSQQVVGEWYPSSWLGKFISPVRDIFESG
jgi:hypothetical protein